MKPASIITLVLLSITSMSTASILFLDGPRKLSVQKSTQQPAVDIKWGEGSEAGTPDNAVNK